MKIRAWKVRDFRRRIKELGCVQLEVSRSLGSHEKWQTPMGTCFQITGNHDNDEVSIGVLKKICKRLAMEGLFI